MIFCSALTIWYFKYKSGCNATGRIDVLQLTALPRHAERPPCAARVLRLFATRHAVPYAESPHPADLRIYPALVGGGILVSGRSAVSVIGATAFPAASCGSASGVPCLVFHPGIRPFPSAPVPFSVSGGTLFLSFSPLPFSSSRIRFPALPVPRFPARVFSSFLRKKENVAFSPQISYICKL